MRLALYTVATNVLVRDLHFDASRHDERRIEVIADGVLVCRDSFLPVCPVAVVAALQAQPWLRPGNAHTLSLLVPSGSICCPWFCGWVGGVPKQPPSFDCSPGHVREAPPLRNGLHVVPAPSHLPTSTASRLLSDVLADSSEVPPLASRMG